VRRQSPILIALAVALAALLSAGSCRAEDPELVTIDSVAYELPERWIGQRIDSSMIAVGDTLVRLPYEFTYDSSRIYVTRATREAFLAMAEAAKKAGVLLQADSGFRSASFQRRIIRRRLAAGEAFARIARHVAPPGYSQHQTGRALDLVPSEARFAFTETYRWLKDHAGKYGFTETYPELTDDANGTWWESWHWMYGGAGEKSGDATPD